MQKKPFPSETQERFIVRLPDGMRDRIAEAAKAAGRSMNSEIVSRLEATFSITQKFDTGVVERLRMERDQREAFLSTVDRALTMQASPQEQHMLTTLRDAALLEIKAIDEKIRKKSQP